MEKKPVNRTGMHKSDYQAKGLKTGIVKMGSRYMQRFVEFIRTKYENRRAVGWTPYGEDDTFPQQVLEILTYSHTLTAAVNLITKFIAGDGFKNAAHFERAVINADGETVYDIYQRVCADVATFGALSINAAYGLTQDVLDEQGNVTKEGGELFIQHLQHVPFELTRKPLENKEDKDFWVVPFADNSRKNNLAEAYRVVPFCTNTQLKAKLGKTKEELFENFCKKPFSNGTLYYDFIQRPGSRFYPKPFYSAALLDALSEKAIKETKLRDIESGFNVRAIITEFVKGDIDDKKKREDAQALADFLGPDGASVMHMYAQRPEDAPKIETLSPTNVDSLYSYTDKSLQNNILLNFFFHPILFGILTPGKLGSTSEIEEAIAYVQKIVINDYQRMIEQAFTRIFAQFSPERRAELQVPEVFEIQNLTIKNAKTLIQEGAV